MGVSELVRTLDHALPSAAGRVSFVVTDVAPECQELARFLDGALAAARRHRVPLVEIQIDMAAYPSMGAFYWHVPVVDSCRSGVVRLIFEADRAEPARGGDRPARESAALAG